MHLTKISLKPATALISLLLIFNAGCVSLLDIGQKTPNMNQPVVEGVPKGAMDRTDIEPYAGPHPRLLKRAPDPFSYPIALGQTGPMEPIFSGPLEYPFLCQTQESGLGQPLVDNQDGIGIPIYEEKNGEITKTKIGYSKDCQLETQANYYFNKKGTTKFFPYTDNVSNEAITQIEVNGQTIPFILRIEWGTVNRHIYSLFALKGVGETIDKPVPSSWNQRLIFEFRGGVGIGFKQGKNRPVSMTEARYEQLSKGYGLIYSSGLQTSNHYDIWESEELVTRLKSQFTALYGKPLYTVGIGASGGGIQQYLLAQNRPGLIDAAIPQYAYPDMVSQTIYALDCDLLEHYFDLEDRDNNFWEKWERRTLIQGLSARSVDEHEYSKLYQWSKLVNGYFPTRPRGMSECVVGWRGPAQVSHNPRYTHYYYRFASDIVKKNHWTHWENIKRYYGTDEHQFANSLWDNEGVQYGLAALNAGDIDFRMFIDINRHVGSWRPQHKMRVARFWKFSGAKDKLGELDIWSAQNIRAGTSDHPAPRGEANPKAIEAAFRSGMVFSGVADIPVIDVRHYVDDIQDMHHSFASFTARQRMMDAMDNIDHHVIWMARRDFNPTDLAFEVIDQWMMNLLENPSQTVAAAKPAPAVDRCFDNEGEVIHEGAGVWDGAWNQKETGECLSLMPNYRSTRQVAGEDIRDLTFKCALQSVDDAVAGGLYNAKADLPENALELLQKTFPDGVCDYSQPGQGELSAQSLGL